VEGGESRGDVFRVAYLEALGRCREEIEGVADPTLYTTSHAADDLDAVREWLGYERLSLWGASYGTKAARVYMRRHPTRVRAAVLHGVVPITFSMWPDLFPAADSALGALFALCEADVVCAETYPDLDALFVDLMARLESDPVRLRVPLADSEPDSVFVRFDHRSLVGLVVATLRSSRAARGLPLLIDRLSHGDFTYVAGMLRPGGPQPIPRGVYLSITCAEELPRLTAEDRARAHGSARLGAGEWLDDEDRECAVWGAGAVPIGFWDPVGSDAPVLLVTGSEDYITPPAYAESVAASLSAATLRVVPQRGHDDIDPCVSALIEEFLIQGHDTDPDLACPEDRDPLPFELPPSSPPRTGE
jgi:pimeloyl-ACP methyl ester carboxylesterase